MQENLILRLKINKSFDFCVNKMCILAHKHYIYLTRYIEKK